ncbi:MAG: DUF2868 domain-containing protein, partial [Candidatus Electrothrix sp. ATG1]|nr:DUF2868 domain-containing protein [Candidatus Electrothrix sp. ATG1]
MRQRYGLLFLRPFFLIVQLFGVSFNTGVLAATLFKVIGTDLAFGWQSTLQVTPASVQKVVHWISQPWSWLPDPFILTLSQIEGSRLVLKDGIYHLANADLTSWWPFLCLSVLCYGLLPRLLLLLLVSTRQQRDLARLDFQQGFFRQILHRMQTPQVSTAARSESKTVGRAQGAGSDISRNAKESSPMPSDRAHEPDKGKTKPSKENSPHSFITALISDELLEECSYSALQEQVAYRLGYQLCQLIPFWTLTQSEEEELVALQKAMNQDKSSDILIVIEAWQPPIEELFSWIRLLRRSLGPTPVFLLTLIGKPTPETILTPVQTQHLHIWKQKTAALSDPGLQLIELVKE